MNIIEYIAELSSQKYYLDEIIVLGPYPTESFVRKLIENDLRKRTPTSGPKITLLVDRIVKQELLDCILKLFPNRTGNRLPLPMIEKIAPFDKKGMVHAKIYYLKFKNYERTRTKQYLLVGSANASDNGFGNNAETYISFDFAEVINRGELDFYINSLYKKCDIKSDLKIYLNKKSYVQLPALSFSSDVFSFDTWLRSGLICHKYLSDPMFGKFKLKLKKALPSSEISDLLERNGLFEVNNSNYIIISYSNSNNEALIDEASKKPTPNIKWFAKYFIETCYGGWVSNSCYSVMKSDFIQQNYDKRLLLLDEILDESNHEFWLDQFEQKLKNLINNYKDLDLHEYIDIRNMDSIRKSNLNKIISDYHLASDPIFRERYLSGNQFTKVPQMGNEFEDFAISFCSSVLLKTKTNANVNKLVVAINNYYGSDADVDANASVLLKFLRESWSDYKVRESITSYFEKRE